MAARPLLTVINPSDGSASKSQVATPDVIYEAPNSTYVADFIGDVNIIEGKVSRVIPNGLSLTWAVGQPEIAARSGLALTRGSNAYFAIRPEKIRISAARPEDAPNAVSGTVLDIAYLGNISTYHVELAGGQVIQAQSANRDRISAREFTWEDAVWLSWTDAAGVVLDR